MNVVVMEDIDDLPSRFCFGGSLFAELISQSPEFYSRFSKIKTSRGYDLENHIQLKCKEGIGALEKDSYRCFEPIFAALINIHSAKRSKVAEQSLKSLVRINHPSIISTNVEMRKNLAGFPFPPVCSRADRRRIFSLVQNACSLLDCGGEFSGEFLSLKDVTNDRQLKLREDGIDFVKPVGASEWPNDRAIYLAFGRRLRIFTNFDDHLIFTCTGEGADFDSLNKSLKSFIDSFFNCLKCVDPHQVVMTNPTFGTLFTNPLRAGTGGSAGAMLKFDRFPQECVGMLQKICGFFQLNVVSRFAPTNTSPTAEVNATESVQSLVVQLSSTCWSGMSKEQALVILLRALQTILSLTDELANGHVTEVAEILGACQCQQAGAGDGGALDSVPEGPGPMLGDNDDRARERRRSMSSISAVTGLGACGLGLGLGLGLGVGSGVGAATRDGHVSPGEDNGGNEEGDDGDSDGLEGGCFPPSPFLRRMAMVTAKMQKWFSKFLCVKPLLGVGGEYSLLSQDDMSLREEQWAMLHNQAIAVDFFPPFGPNNESALARWLTPAIHDRLMGLRTASRFSLDDAIRPAVEIPNCVVGIVAGDAQCYTMFQEIFLPVIKDVQYVTERWMRRQRRDKGGQPAQAPSLAWTGTAAMATGPSFTHLSDMTPHKLGGLRAIDASYVTQCSCSVVRNIEGFALMPAIKCKERRIVHRLLTNAIESLHVPFVPPRRDRSHTEGSGDGTIGDSSRQGRLNEGKGEPSSSQLRGRFLPLPFAPPSPPPLYPPSSLSPPPLFAPKPLHLSIPGTKLSPLPSLGSDSQWGSGSGSGSMASDEASQQHTDAAPSHSMAPDASVDANLPLVPAAPSDTGPHSHMDTDTALCEHLRQEGVDVTRPIEGEFLDVTGCARDWPDARSIFVSEDEQLVIVVNAEDHLRIVSACSCGVNKFDIVSAFRRMTHVLRRIDESVSMQMAPQARMCGSAQGRGVGSERGGQRQRSDSAFSAKSASPSASAGRRLGPARSGDMSAMSVTSASSVHGPPLGGKPGPVSVSGSANCEPVVPSLASLRAVVTGVDVVPAMERGEAGGGVGGELGRDLGATEKDGGGRQHVGDGAINAADRTRSLNPGPGAVGLSSPVVTEDETCFQRIDIVGNVSTCPRNVGAGVSASMVLRLRCLSRSEDTLKSVCENIELTAEPFCPCEQGRERTRNGSSVTATSSMDPSTGGRDPAECERVTKAAPRSRPRRFDLWKISNKYGYGKTEVQVVQSLIDGVAALIEMDKKLEDGSAQVEEFIALPPVAPLPPPPLCWLLSQSQPQST